MVKYYDYKLMNLKSFIRKNYLIFGLLLLGISLRLIYGLLFNQMVDYMNILALVKSIADTGNFTYGLIALKRLGFEVQLYGKIYYQIIALWLKFLDQIGIVPLKFIFDTKPLQDPSSYMIGLWQWSPPLYQLTIIKLIQFLWDFIFVFFLYKTTKIINKNLAWLSILFWAINPYFMMINYAFFMPEIFMLASFAAGLYFWLKIVKDNKQTTFNKTLALFFLVLGAIIKQLPLLIIPYFIMSISKNKKNLFFYSGLFFIFYFFLKQGWSNDSFFINKFFLFSNESMAILRNNFNSMPYFLIFYSLFFLAVFKNKDKVFRQYDNIILLIIAIISLTYINDPVSFIQFTIWILPFTFLAAITSSKYIYLFNLSFFAVLIKGFINEFYLSPMLSPTIGAMFNEFLSNKVFINNFFSFDIYDLILKFIIFLCYLLIFIESVSLIFYKKTIFADVVKQIKFNFSVQNSILILFISYIIFVIFDFQIKSSFILLPQKEYQITTQEIELTKKPITIKIDNPQMKKIKALQILIIKKGKITHDDYLILKFLDENGSKILTKKISDFQIPSTTDEPLIVFLPKTINKKRFAIKIFKEKNLNETVVYKSSILDHINKPKNGLYNGYEKPDETSLIKVHFDKEENIFPLYFRGQYELKDILLAIKNHLQGKLKKVFFISYALVSLFLLVFSLILIVNKKILFFNN